MTLVVLKQKIDEIAAELSPHFRLAVSEFAGQALRDAVSVREGGRYVDFSLFWTEAVDVDFVTASDKLEEMFSEKTGERVVDTTHWRGAKVLKRPSAFWLEGKQYRIPLVRAWSIAEHETIKWAAGLTDFARMAIWRSRYEGRSKTTVDAPSEYLAEKAMRDLFEKYFAR